jgi:septum site-determining protein MinC
MKRVVNPFELEGMVSTVTVLRLSSSDLGAVKKALAEKVEQLPGFFQDAPIVVDLTALEGNDDETADEAHGPREEVPLMQLAALLRELKVVPIGIRNLRDARRAEARAAGFGVIHGGAKRPARVAKAHEPAPREEPSDERRDGERPREGVSAGPLLLRAPLRSGQVIYAEQCDAVVLAPVNAGAEIIADGNIHVYASLRGRALAGAHGNEDARIFCKSLDADLIAIAGCYLRADEIPEARRGKPAQIFLENGKLVVAEL